VKCPAKPGSCLWVALLLEGNATEFHREAFISRGKPIAFQENPVRVIPPPQLGQSAAIVVVKVWIGDGLRVACLHNLLPARLLEE
jgi:hypothetical protein